MTIQASTDTQVTETTASPDLSELSFADYEKARRGEIKSEGTKSAPEAKATEQKKSTESGTEETEEEERKLDESEDESEEDADESDDTVKDKPKKKGGFQRRIDKLNARYSEERNRREALESRLAQVESAGKPKAEQIESKPAEGKPSPDSFDTHSEYVEALTDWKLEQRERSAKEQAERSELASKQKELLKSHVERVQSFAKETDDFQEVLSEVDDIPVSAAVQEIILSSENGPELMYELAKNRDEYARICKLPPLAAARELGKIESKIARSSDQTKPETKKLTKAPKPLEPVNGGKGKASKSIDDPNISFSDYERLRREQLRSKK